MPSTILSYSSHSAGVNPINASRLVSSICRWNRLANPSLICWTLSLLEEVEPWCAIRKSGHSSRLNGIVHRRDEACCVYGLLRQCSHSRTEQLSERCQKIAISFGLSQIGSKSHGARRGIALRLRREFHGKLLPEGRYGS